VPTVRRSAIAAGALVALTAVEVATIVVVALATHADVQRLVDGFVVSNLVLGTSFVIAGWPIAHHRPANPIGWLFLAGGLLYTTSATGYAVLLAGAPPGADSPGWRLLATVTNGSWPWAVTLCLPLALLLFPDGRLPGPRWRWLVAVFVVVAVVFEVGALASSETLTTDLRVTAYLSSTRLDSLAWVGGVVSAAGNAAYVAVAVSLVLRYRRGDERTRRQLLWLLVAVVVSVTAFVVSDVLAVDSWFSIFVIATIPASVAIAVLRYELLDIRIVVSRSLLYVALTAGVVGSYVLVVALIDGVVRRGEGLRASLIATLLIAIAFNPVRVWLQRRLDAVFYGARRDPVRLVAEVGASLEDVPRDDLSGVLEVLCRAMRFPSAVVVAQGKEVAAHGDPPALRQSVPLRHRGEVVGELTVGLRSGESRLASADERVIALLAAPLAVAVHATSLAEDLGRANAALVTAREEERQRIRRDLHDGLGPVLTGVVLKADAARRLVRSTSAPVAASPTGGRAPAGASANGKQAAADPSEVERLLSDVRTQTTEAVDEIRRLVSQLRPPALDGLGLVGALREQAVLLAQRADGTPLSVQVEASDPWPALPAAAEVTAYRIVTEALTNVSRHSHATTATVRLRADGGVLSLAVEDDGVGDGDSDGGWTPGVGLTSMRERVGELGGTWSAGPSPTGGRVTALIPVAGAR
jgi:two-component system NarL family sensor kinase